MPSQHRPLLYFNPLASLVSTLSWGAKVSLNIAQFLTDTALNSTKASISFTLSLLQSSIISAISFANKSSNQRGVYGQVITHYSNLSIASTLHIVSLTHLISITCFHLTHETIRLSLKAAQSLVEAIDGIFGSNETSRAISAFAALVVKQFDHEKSVFALASVAKALTAWACLDRFSNENAAVLVVAGIVDEEDDLLVVEASGNRQLVCEYDQKDALVQWFSESDGGASIEIDEPAMEPPAVFNIPDFSTSSNTVADYNKVVDFGREFSDQLSILEETDESVIHDDSLDQTPSQYVPSVNDSSSCSISNNQIQLDSQTIYSSKRKRSVLRLRPSTASLVEKSHSAFLIGPKEKAQLSQQEKQMLAQNLERYMKMSTASYGSEFMKILGIGKLASFNTTDKKHPADHYGFATHAEIPLNSILLSSDIATIHHYVVLDHAARSVVVAFRGTIGVSDVMVDVMCEYKHITLHGVHGMAHSGMWEAALALSENHRLIHCISTALKANPTFRLVLTGHSLGGGVASLLALIWSKTFPSVHCFAFGAPCTVSPSLIPMSKQRISTLVHAADLIPALSLGLLQDFMKISKQLLHPQNQGVCESVIGKTLGQTGTAMDKEWLSAVYHRLKDCMDSEKLLVPGTLYHLHSWVSDVVVVGGRVNRTRRVDLSLVEGFELRFCARMIHDHSPAAYEEAIHALRRVV